MVATMEAGPETAEAATVAAVVVVNSVAEGIIEGTIVVDPGEAEIGVPGILQTLQMACATAIMSMGTRVTFVPPPSRALG